MQGLGLRLDERRTVATRSVGDAFISAFAAHRFVEASRYIGGAPFFWFQTPILPEDWAELAGTTFAARTVQVGTVRHWDTTKCELLEPAGLTACLGGEIHDGTHVLLYDIHVAERTVTLGLCVCGEKVVRVFDPTPLACRG